MSKVSDNEAFARAVQKWLGVKIDGWAGGETMSAFLAKTGQQAESGPKIPDSYWPMLSKIESGDRPYIQAASSSASGLYQFVRATWLAEGGKWGPTLRPAFGGLKPSAEEQLQRAKTFTQKNANALHRAGIPVNEASLYASHFLGVGTAIKALEGDIKDPISAHVGSAAIQANPTILKGTVADFLSWLHRKTGVWAK